MNNVKAYILPESKLRLILTKVPSAESCAVSLMIRVGSIYEHKHIHGGAHVIEHMMFKGTKDLPNKSELAKVLDSMGALYNAYTDYTMTSYHIKVQKKYLSEVIKILCQMVSQSLFRKEDLIAEKPVVVEELRRERDDPAAYIQELYYQTVFKHCKFGRPIGGEIKDVNEMKYSDLKKFWKENYTIDNIVISVAGNSSIEGIVDTVVKSNLLNEIGHSSGANNMIVHQKLQTKPRYRVQSRENMKQVQIALGFPCFGNQNPDRFILKVLRCILGGNMSSRLFIKLRDEYGLAYTVSANTGLYDDVGEFSVSTGVDGSNIFSGNLDKKKGKGDPLAVIFNEIFKMVLSPVSKDELHTAKEYIKGGMLLEFEDNQNICEFYGRELLLGHPVLTIQAYLDAIDKVTIQDIHRISKMIFVPNRMNLSLIGNITEDDVKKYLDKSMTKWTSILSNNTGGSISNSVLQDQKKWYEF